MRTHRGTPLRRVLVVEDDLELCRSIAEVAAGWGAEVSEAHSLEAAVPLLDTHPDVLIADLWLQGASAIPLLAAAVHRRPSPAIVAMSGQASREETFQLGRLNVRAFLPKPLSIKLLESAVEEALEQPPDVEPWIVDLVGHDSLKGVQRKVRGTMLEEALARSEGSRSRAARILRVSRQAIQQVLQRDRRPRKSPTAARPQRPSGPSQRPPAAG
jgi:two-component system, response regulator RegA